MTVKWHNLPALPNFLRAYNGFVFGTVPHLLEPMWSYLPGEMVAHMAVTWYNCAVVLQLDIRCLLSTILAG